MSETTEQAHKEVPACGAIKTEPPEHAKVAQGPSVVLFVSTGPETVSVPDVVGELPEAGVTPVGPDGAAGHRLPVLRSRAGCPVAGRVGLSERGI